MAGSLREKGGLLVSKFDFVGKKSKLFYPSAKIEDIEPEWERRFQEAEPLRRIAWRCIL